MKILRDNNGDSTLDSIYLFYPGKSHKSNQCEVKTFGVYSYFDNT